MSVGPRMLDGIRVLEVCDESGFLAGKILAELGAEVIVLEPPGGAPERRRGPFLRGHTGPEYGLLWLAMNTSKRSVVLDFDAPDAGTRLDTLCAHADVLLETPTPGEAPAYDAAALCAAHPHLVRCSITPFGRTGPRAHWRGGDLVAVATGGNASVTGDPDRPPVRCSLPSAYYHAGPEAVLGVLMALAARERDGCAPAVDVSLQECQLQTLLSGAGQFPMHGRRTPRPGARVGRTREIWRARDGFVSFGLRGGPSRVPNLIATVAYMEECELAPAWLRETDWSRYSHNTLSDEELARLEAAFGAFFATRDRAELYAEALERRILLAPCNDAAALLAHPQLRARELFTRVKAPDGGDSLELPSFFARSSAFSIGVRSAAPWLGECDAAATGETPASRAAAAPVPRDPRTGEEGIYAGLRILELGAGAASPVASRYFAAQGATVVRVESRARPDFLRLLHLRPGEPLNLDAAPMFALLNADKHSVALNLKEPDAVALVRRLALEWADVVSENFAPGVLARLGLDPAALVEENPRLVVISGCLYGQTGPQRGYPGFGGQGAAIAGFNHLTGWPDREAVGPYGTITDSLSPRYVALLIAAALRARDRTGRGQVLDVSQIETGVYSLSEWVLRQAANGEDVTRRGNRGDAGAPQGIYPCAGEERWIAIEAPADRDWGALCAAAPGEPWTRDPRFARAADRRTHEEALDAALTTWTSRQERDALAERLQAAGVAAAPVQDFADLHADPQLAHREHFVPRAHRHLGTLHCEQPGFRLAAYPHAIERAGPDLGEHDRAVLGGILGLGADEIEALVERKVVH